MKLSHSFSSIKMYENCPYRYYHQRVKKSVVDQGGEASLYGERVHKFLEDRLKGDAPLPQEVEGYEPLVASVEKLCKGGELLTEQELTLNVDLKPTGWFDKDAWLRTKIDVLILKNNTAVVLDWKTGKRRPDFSQLELYAAQVFTHHPQIDRISSGFIWLKDQAMDKNVYTREEHHELWQAVLERISRIEKSLETDTWPAKPSGLCKFCPAKHLCRYSR